MVTYVSLINWTDQGIANYRDTIQRADDFKSVVEKAGGRVREVLWTIGECDLVSVAEFPDDETAVATLLKVSAVGNVRTRTMRAFDSAGMADVIARTT